MRMTLRNLAPALLLFALPAFAQRGERPAQAPAETPGAAKPAEPMKNPLPADKSVAQTITVHGKTLHYTATVGTILIKNRDEKPTGAVMYTAYVLDKDKSAPSRPVTFALNGGPGASSVYLNMGAIGPKRVVFGNEGDSASDPAMAAGALASATFTPSMRNAPPAI